MKTVIISLLFISNLSFAGIIVNKDHTVIIIPELDEMTAIVINSTILTQPEETNNEDILYSGD